MRIIRDIYPPRIDLNFKLTGADGTVLKSGKRRLRNAALLSGRTSSRNEPLACERALIDSWLDRGLPR